MTNNVMNEEVVSIKELIDRIRAAGGTYTVPAGFQLLVDGHFELTEGEKAEIADRPSAWVGGQLRSAVVLCRAVRGELPLHIPTALL